MTDTTVTTAAPEADTIAAGAAAWTRVKGAAKTMREDWRAVGEALLTGRRLHTASSGGLNKTGFGRWCRDNGFGDIAPSVRSNAIWLAENWESVLQSLQDGDSHPTNIRATYRAAARKPAEKAAGEGKAPDAQPRGTAGPAALLQVVETPPASSGGAKASEKADEAMEASAEGPETPPVRVSLAGYRKGGQIDRGLLAAAFAMLDEDPETVADTLRGMPRERLRQMHDALTRALERLDASPPAQIAEAA